MALLAVGDVQSEQSLDRFNCDVELAHLAARDRMLQTDRRRAVTAGRVRSFKGKLIKRKPLMGVPFGAVALTSAPAIGALFALPIAWMAVTSLSFVADARPVVGHGVSPSAHCPKSSSATPSGRRARRSYAG